MICDGSHVSESRCQNSLLSSFWALDRARIDFIQWATRKRKAQSTLGLGAWGMLRECVGAHMHVNRARCEHENKPLMRYSLSNASWRRATRNTSYRKGMSERRGRGFWYEGLRSCQVALYRSSTGGSALPIARIRQKLPWMTSSGHSDIWMGTSPSKLRTVINAYNDRPDPAIFLTITQFSLETLFPLNPGRT